MRARSLALRGLLSLSILGATGVVAELALRAWPPAALRSATAWRSIAGEGAAGVAYTTDDELGYRPVLGGPRYGPHGAIRNEYTLEKPAGVRRLLFLGDSVTYRAKIQEGLRTLLGDGGFEYWNAGVTGYSTTQEVPYYLQYCAEIRADHVLLTFHLNDFESTPVVFRDGERLIRFHSEGSRTLSPWLLEHSFLYRVFCSLGEPETGMSDWLRSCSEIEGALVTLRDELARRGSTLSVLVLPWLRPPAQWPTGKQPRRQWILATLARLGIAHHDFLSTLEQALLEGVDVTEFPRDPQHPSAEFGLRMARDLLADGFVP